MPSSNWHMVPEVVAMVDQVHHDRVLDVGPGRGKYAVALRELLSEPPSVIDAVEMEPSYITRWLVSLYDTVTAKDVRDLTDEQLAAYDLVLMVDVIEHLELDDAMQLLGRIPGRVAICTPVDFFSNGPGLPASETHRSHWTDVQWDALEQRRKVEVRYQSLGGWLVRLGPQSKRRAWGQPR